MKLRRRAGFAFLCIVMVFLGQSGSQGAPQEAVPTVVIRPQQVGFFVRDTENRQILVDDLPRERFRIYEKVPGKGWQTPEVKSVFGGEQPLLLALVLDTSDSVFRTEAGPVKKLLQEFLLTAMHQERDAALLLPFREVVDDRRVFADDPSALLRDIGGLSGGGGTALFDALLTAVQRLQEEEGERGIGEYRKAIILLSDGQENASAIEPEKFDGDAIKAHMAKKRLVEEALLGSDIPVYVLYPDQSDSERMPLIQQGIWSSPQTSGQWLREIARNTGGTFFPFMSDKERKVAFGRVSEELAHKYWLLFYPAPRVGDELSREVKIEVVKADDEGNTEKDKRYKVVGPPKFFFQQEAISP